MSESLYGDNTPITSNDEWSDGQEYFLTGTAHTQTLALPELEDAILAALEPFGIGSLYQCHPDLSKTGQTDWFNAEFSTDLFTYPIHHNVYDEHRDELLKSMQSLVKETPGIKIILTSINEAD